MSISDVLAGYEQTRRQNEDEQLKRRRKVYAAVPQLKDIHRKLTNQLAERLRLAVSGEKADEAAIAELRAQETALLKNAGFPADYLEPLYTCLDCRDTGLLANATHCSCFKKKLLEDKLEAARLTDESVSFSHFRLDIFDDTPLDNGKSQRAYMEKYKQLFENYAESFPDCLPVLMLLGNTGLGKTYCAKCIMRRVIERGHTAALYTAYRLFSLFHADRLGEDVDLGPLFEVPLLIIDDLGTEPMTKNVTIEYFFDLLNERLAAGRHTIIITNLELHDLNTRYGERIHSRLMDTRFSQKIIFKGKDVRY